MPDGLCGVRHRRPGAPDQAKVGVESPNGGHDGRGERAIGLGLVVEGAVRLDVAEECPLRPHDGIQCSQLIEQKILDVRLGQLLGAPPKVFPIVVARVGTDSDTLVDGQRITEMLELQDKSEFQIGTTTIMLIVTEDA